MKKAFKVFSFTFVPLILILGVAGFQYLQQDRFGKAPSGNRLDQIQSSPNYENGEFQNLTFTPDFSEGHSMGTVMYDQLFKDHPRQKPESPLPSVKTDLRNIAPGRNILVWFGHSSYFIQLEGKTILVDPVFSGNASPIPGTMKAFEGTDRYSVDDLPDIDVLLISHDHYDHLDYTTITKLKNKTKTVISGLGVGGHFERWGYTHDQIREQDWNQSFIVDSSLSVHTLPARHYSGRGFKRKNTLWASYLIETPEMKIYVGGDSGYGPHFSDIGEKFGSIDLALLDNGQYNEAWREMHLHPEEVVTAATDLKAKRLFPVHNSKFPLGMHPWDEPLKQISILSEEHGIPLVTPKIGELVDLNNMNQDFTNWWEAIY